MRYLRHSSLLLSPGTADSRLRRLPPARGTQLERKQGKPRHLFRQRARIPERAPERETLTGTDTPHRPADVFTRRSRNGGCNRQRCSHRYCRHPAR